MCKSPPPKDILWIEQEFIVPVHNSAGEYLETPLLTVLDLVSMDDGRMKISEFKTSGRAYGEFEVDTSLQATCYVNALWENIAKLPSVEFTVLVKTKTPKIQRVKTHRTEEDFGRLGDIIETVDRCVQQSLFYPIETPMNCSGCCYRTQCREWKPTQPSGGQLHNRHRQRGLHMLTELGGKGGSLCELARRGELKCPLMVRATSEDILTGNIFTCLQAINPRWWLPDLLNTALGSNRFTTQFYRRFTIDLWRKQPTFPAYLLPWEEGKTEVDVEISWENPPTTVFIEMKYGLSIVRHDREQQRSKRTRV